jgi:hypothetical protein
MSELARPVAPAYRGEESSPDLGVTVVDVAAEPHAATPTLRFDLEIESRNGVRVRSAMITAQVRIAADRRPYDATEQARLADVFGGADQWSTALRSFYWTHATFVVPPFDERTVVGLLVPCTFDFEVVAAKYLHSVVNGVVPLELLFSGSVFYSDDEGLLKTTRLNWATEASFRFPVRVWKEMIDHYFPESAWIRMRRDAFDRLCAYKTQRALTSWEQTIDTLLREASPSRRDA